MKRRNLHAAMFGVWLTLGAAASGILRAEGPLQPPLIGTSPIYGYDRYEFHHGPVEAQRELGYLTHQPGIRGLDEGYGIGYFFGFGPPGQHRAHASHHTSARGLIDARWSSGYTTGGRAHHSACGAFCIRPGCTCLTPTQYRDFAPRVVPAGSQHSVGGSWYTGSPATSLGPPAGVLTEPDSEMLPVIEAHP